MTTNSILGEDVIPARPQGAFVPLSSDQEHIWLHGVAAGDVPLYNEAITIHRDGPCDPERLSAALNKVIALHEIWRTDFQQSASGLRQRVHPAIVLHVPFVDLSSLKPTDREAEATRLATSDARKSFDLAQAPLLRARIIKFAGRSYRLYLALHHIIFDGVSLYRVFLPLLGRIYAGEHIETPPSTLQYADYTAWRNQWLQGPAAARQTAYWMQTLAGDLPTLKLPSDRPAPPVPSYRGNMEKFSLSADLSRKVKTCSSSHDLTQYVWLLTVFEALMFRYTHQTDIIVGSVTDLRTRSVLEPVVGYFLNSLPIRTSPAATTTFLAYARQTSDAVLGMIDACEIPLSHLVQNTRRNSGAAIHPLFQVVFSIQPPAPPVEGGWDLTQMDVTVGTAKFDLYVELEDRREGIVGRIIFSTDLFDPPTIRRMIGHYTTLLESSLADPTCPLAELSLLTDAEKTRLRGWNDTARPCGNLTLNQLIEAQSRRTPNARAITAQDGDITYADLDCRATTIANALIRHGVQPGDVIAICLDRSITLVAALLGVLKAGAAYLPLDPTHPRQRSADCIRRGACRLLLTQPRLAAHLTTITIPHIVLQPTSAPQSVAPDATPPQEPSALAYVICTSGSTGKPKALEISHGNVVNVLKAIRTKIDFKTTDSLLAITTIAFDIAALEIFLPLIVGARIILPPSGVTANPVLLNRYIGQTRPTIIQATPTTWKALVDAGWRAPRHTRILVGGEALPRALAEELLERASAVWNVYGPTETTIWSTIHRVTHSTAAVPIGKPLANTTVFVVSPDGSALPTGVPGELCIGGAGVARGYRGDPARTANRFTTLPAAPNERVYRTGDIVRQRENGELEWLGRNDDQLKIRGHRVEPFEIETVLAAIPGVSHVAVVATTDVDGVAQLTAHVVAPGFRSDSLRNAAASRLPGYMIPAYFHLHQTLPQTSNGKIDRVRLADVVPDNTRTLRPLSSLEAAIAEVWRSVLKLSEVGATDNFFASGGHSLLAVRLLETCRATFGCAIPLRNFLGAPTIEGLARAIGRKRAPSLPTTKASQALTLRLLRPARGTSRGNVFGMPGLKGNAMAISTFAANALPNYDVWAFSLDMGGRKLNESGRYLDCAREITETLARASTPQPSALIGFSIGGFLAYLVAAQRMQQGALQLPAINLDGGIPADLPSAARHDLTRLTALEATALAPRLLLLTRASAGHLTLPVRSEAHWHAVGLIPAILGYRTVRHTDMILPEVIRAAAPAIEKLLDLNSPVLAPGIADVEPDSSGGRLHRLLSEFGRPCPNEIRSLIADDDLVRDKDTRAALLFLSVATGEVECALDYCSRLAAQAPNSRAVAYTRVAVLAAGQRQQEALAVARAWCANHPADLAMHARATRKAPSPRPPVVLGSPASIDLALAKHKTATLGWGDRQLEA